MTDTDPSRKYRLDHISIGDAGEVLADLTSVVNANFRLFNASSFYRPERTPSGRMPAYGVTAFANKLHGAFRGYAGAHRDILVKEAIPGLPGLSKQLDTYLAEYRTAKIKRKMAIELQNDAMQKEAVAEARSAQYFAEQNFDKILVLLDKPTVVLQTANGKPTEVLNRKLHPNVTSPNLAQRLFTLPIAAVSLSNNDLQPDRIQTHLSAIWGSLQGVTDNIEHLHKDLRQCDAEIKIPVLDLTVAAPLLKENTGMLNLIARNPKYHVLSAFLDQNGVDRNAHAVSAVKDGIYLITDLAQRLECKLDPELKPVFADFMAFPSQQPDQFKEAIGKTVSKLHHDATTAGTMTPELSKELDEIAAGTLTSVDKQVRDDKEARSKAVARLQRTAETQDPADTAAAQRR